jgi:uncharacterized repeat protein (TIGR01451 family)/fimbrial isopeptide formation D2 family protein
MWINVGIGLSLALVLTVLTLAGMTSFSQAAVPAANSRDVNLYRLNEEDINPPENSELEPGGMVTYVYEIDNRSDEQTMLLFTSTLPAELVYVDADPAPTGGSAMLFTWTDTLEPDEEWYVTITAQLPPTQNVLHAYFANQVSAMLSGTETTEVDPTNPVFTWHYVSNAVIAKETTTGWNYAANEEDEAVAGEEISFTVTFTVPQGTIAYAPTPRILLQDGLWPTSAQPAWTGAPVTDQENLDPEAKSRTCFTQLDFVPLASITETDAGPQVFTYTVYAHPRQHYFLTGEDCKTGQETEGGRLMIQPMLRWCDGPGCTVTETNDVHFSHNDDGNDVTIIAPEVLPTVDHVYLDADEMGQGGEQVRFDIQVRNGSGRPTAYGVELTATLSSGLAYDSHSASPSGDSQGTMGDQTYVNWTVPMTLPASTSWDASVTATLPANFAIGTQYTVTADVSFESFDGDVEDEGLYTLSDVYVINPGLKHVKYADPDQVTIGDTATYTVVTTLGKGTFLYSPYYSDTLPLGFHYLPGTFSLEPSAVLDDGPMVFDGATKVGQQDLVWYLADQDLSSASEPLVITVTYQVEISGIDTDGQAVYNSSISSAVSVYNGATIYWRAIQGDPDSVVFLGMADTINNRVQVVQPYLRNDLETVRTDAPFLDKEVGQSISFDTSFENDGKSTAYDVHVCDELPTGFAYASRDSFTPSSCGALAPVSEPQAGNEGTVCFIIDAVCAGEGVQIEYTLDVLPSASPGISTTNKVSISDYSSQPGGSNDGNSDDDDLPAGVNFDRHYGDFPEDALPAEVDCSSGSGCPFFVKGLAASLVADQTFVQPGDTIVYTIDYENTSASHNYSNIVITNNYEAHLSFVGSTLTPDVNDPAQRLLAWNVDSVLARDGSGPFQVTMQVADALGGAESIMNSINLSAQDEAQTVVTPGPYVLYTPVDAPDLHIQIDGPSKTYAGDSIAYTVVYSNDGTINAQSVVLTLDYGEYLTFESATLDGDSISPEPGTDDTFADPDELPNDGSTRTLVVQVAVAAPLPHDLAQIDNSASVQSDASLAVTAYETVVLMRPQFTTFRKTGPEVAPPNVGNVVPYQFHLVNTGDYTATNCILTDTWGSGLNFSTSGDWVNHGTYATLDVEPATLGPGEQASVGILYVTIANVQDKYTNVAELSCDQTGVIMITRDTWAASIATAKTASAASAFPGRMLTYTINYTNTGGTVIDAVITDSMPLGFNYQGQDSGVASTSACIQGWQFQGVAGQDAAWVCSTLSEDATGQLQVWGLVTTDSAYEGTYLENETASLYEGTVRPIEEPLYTRIERPWLAVVKDDGGASPAAPGDYITYTLTYHNYGTAPAYGVTITDQWPEQVDFVSCGGSCEYDLGSRTVTWGPLHTAYLELPTDTQRAVSFVVQVKPGTEGQSAVNDNYKIAATSLDPVVGPTITTDILAPHLGLSKTAYPDIVDSVNDQFDYTITYVNDGGGILTGVVITDHLPGNALYVSSSPECSGGSGVGVVVSCTIGSLTQAQTGTVQIKAASVIADQDITNQAQGDSDQTDPTTSNTATVWYDADGCYEVRLADFSSNSPVAQGQSMNFTASYLPQMSAHPITFTWDFGDGAQSVLTETVAAAHIYASAGTYSVTLDVDNECPQAAIQYQHEVEVLPGQGYYVYLPLLMRISDTR